MLICLLAKIWNIFFATPDCDFIPTPITDILATTALVDKESYCINDLFFSIRFFAKKVGEKVPFEIKRNFMNLDPLYIYYAIAWKLRGNRIEVMRSNIEAVFLADKKFRGLKVLINNYIKYYI